MQACIRIRELIDAQFYGSFPPGADPGGAIAPRKTYENTFIYHDFVQFGKHHSRFQGHFVIHCFVTALL